MKKHKCVIGIFLSIIIISLVMTACAVQTTKENINVIPEFTDDITGTTSKEERIQLNIYSSTLKIGEFFNLITSTFSDRSFEIEYSSSNTSVATVSSQGRVTGISEGTCIISVSGGGLVSTCSVTVYDDSQTVTPLPTTLPTTTATSEPPDTAQPTTPYPTVIKPTEIKIKDIGDDFGLDVGEKITLSAEVFPEGASQEVIWLLSNDRVATLESSTGVLKATYAPNDNGKGYAVVTAMSADGSVRDSFELTVYQRAKRISIKNEDCEINIGDEFKVSYRYSPDNSYKVKVSYSSSNEEIVKVDSEGNVTAISPGKARIKVTYSYNEDVYDTMTVTVLADDPVEPPEDNIGDNDTPDEEPDNINDNSDQTGNEPSGDSNDNNTEDNVFSDNENNGTDTVTESNSNSESFQ